MQQAWQCRCLNHYQSEGVGFAVCRVGLKHIQKNGYKKKPYSLRLHGTDIRIGLHCTFIGIWHFGSEWRDTGDTTDTNFTLWTDNTNCWSIVAEVHKFTGGPSGLGQTVALDINKSLPHWAFSCSTFFKLYSCWLKRQKGIITITSTCWTKDGPYCMKSLFRKCVCFWQLFADGAQSDWHAERWLVDTRIALHSL